MYGFTTIERYHRSIPHWQFRWNRPAFAAECHTVLITRQAIESRAIQAGKTLQLIERTGLIECLRVQLKRMQCCITAGAAASMFFQALFMRRRIGTEEKFFAPRNRRRHQSLTMGFALEHWQAIVMRTNTTLENLVAVIKQVVRSNGRSSRPLGSGDIVSGILGSDMLKHHFQCGHVAS